MVASSLVVLGIVAAAPIPVSAFDPSMLSRDVLPQQTYGPGWATVTQVSLVYGLGADVYLSLDNGGHPLTVGWNCGGSFIEQAQVTAPGIYYPNNLHATMTGTVTYSAQVSCRFQVYSSWSWSVNGASWVEVWMYDSYNPNATGPLNSAQPLTTAAPSPSPLPSTTDGSCWQSLAPDMYGPPALGPQYCASPSPPPDWQVDARGLVGTIYSTADPSVSIDEVVTVGWTVDPVNYGYNSGDHMMQCGVVGTSSGAPSTNWITGGTYNGYSGINVSGTMGPLTIDHNGTLQAYCQSTDAARGLRVKFTLNYVSGPSPAPSASPSGTTGDAPLCTFLTGFNTYFIAACDQTSVPGAIKVSEGGFNGTHPELTISCPPPPQGDANPFDWLGYVTCSSVKAVHDGLLGIWTGFGDVLRAALVPRASEVSRILGGGVDGSAGTGVRAALNATTTGMQTRLAIASMPSWMTGFTVYGKRVDLPFDDVATAAAPVRPWVTGLMYLMFGFAIIRILAGMVRSPGPDAREPGPQ